MKKILILTVMATLLFATSAMAFDEGSLETRCFTLSPFCDKIYINWTMGAQIWGYDDACGGTQQRIGGWIYSTQNWVMFLDYLGESQGQFEYGLIKGAGKKGTLYRWETDGTQAASVSVTLVDCTLTLEGGEPSGDLE